MSNEHTYKLKYDLKCSAGTFSKEDVKSSNDGLTDAFLFFSMLYPEDGSFSMQFHGFDGRKGEVGVLEDKEIFKVWTMLAARMRDSRTLSERQKEFAGRVFDDFRVNFLGITSPLQN